MKMRHVWMTFSLDSCTLAKGYVQATCTVSDGGVHAE